MRFIAALRVLREVRQLSDPDSLTEMQAFLDGVVDATKLPFSGNDSMPKRSGHKLDFNALARQKDFPVTIDDELVVQAQIQSDKIPNRLALFANYASCVSGELCPSFVELLVGDSETSKLMRPPLEFLPNGEIGFSGTPEFGNNIVRSVAVSHGLFEVACGRGEIALSGLPKVVQESEGLDSFVKKSISHMIIDTDNQ